MSTPESTKVAARPVQTRSICYHYNGHVFVDRFGDCGHREAFIYDGSTSRLVPRYGHYDRKVANHAGS